MALTTPGVVMSPVGIVGIPGGVGIDRAPCCPSHPLWLLPVVGGYYIAHMMCGVWCDVETLPLTRQVAGRTNSYLEEAPQLYT